MVRKGPYKKRAKGPTYLNKDNTKLKVIMYLYFVGKSNKYRMLNDKDSGLKNQEWSSFDNTLNIMVEEEWIKKYQSEDAKNVSMYTLREKGEVVAKFIQDNNDETKPHPFFSLDAFHDVKYFGKVNS